MTKAEKKSDDSVSSSIDRQRRAEYAGSGYDGYINQELKILDKSVFPDNPVNLPPTGIRLPRLNDTAQ